MITVERLTKVYGGRRGGRRGGLRAVDDLSFTVGPGRVTGFLGPNGSGKTTTLRMLLGLARPTSGTATFGGRAYRDLPQPLREVGAVLDQGATDPAATGRQHLTVAATAAGLDPHRADTLLDLVGLTAAADRRTRGYSLGMRQRLAIATALLGDPGTLILDEPANGLDPRGMHWLRGFLRGLADEGRTVLVSSHVLAELAQTADEVVIIESGRLVRQAPVADLLADGRRVHARTPDPDRLAAALAGRGAVTATADLLVVDGLTCEDVGRAAAAHGIVLTGLAPATGLEDAFLALTAPAGDLTDPGALR